MYLIRSVKYFCALCVFSLVIMGLNLMTGFAQLTFEQTLSVLFSTPRGMLLPVAIVVLSLLYPRFGFVSRKVEGDVEENRVQILTAFENSGFELCNEQDGEMTFRAKGFLRRLMMLYEDEIKVSQYGQWILLDGNRRGVARAEYRLDSYIRMKKRYDDQE